MNYTGINLPLRLTFQNVSEDKRKRKCNIATLHSRGIHIH